MMALRIRLLVFCLLLVPSTIHAEENISQQWQLATPGKLPQALLCDKKGETLFVALKTGGVAVYDIRNLKSAKQTGLVSKNLLQNLDAMNLALQGDYLFVALGDFFTHTSHAGLAIIDVKNRNRPKVLSVWKSKEPMKGSAVVAVGGDHAYLGAMSFGILTFDVKNPKLILHLTTMQPDIHFPRKNPNSIQHPNARGMTLKENILFVTYDAGGLRLIDVSNPKRPKETGRYINAGMGNKQQAYNNIVIDGSKAYLAIDYAGLEILDISNLKKIRQLGWWNPWDAETGSNIWFNSPGHTNQLVLDKKRNLVLLSAGDSELLVVDVSKPKLPKLSTSFGKPKNGLGVWGLNATKQTIYLGYIQSFVPFHGKWSGIKAVRWE